MTAIPDGWSARPLAALVEYKAGRTPPRATTEYWVAGADRTPWVSIADMPPFGVVRTTKERISPSAVDSVFGGKVVPAGTLLMSFKLTIGRVATLGVPACHNEAIVAIYPCAEVDQRFLAYFLSQVNYKSLQDRQIKGNTLNREKLDRIEVRTPPMGEQVALAAVLDAAFRATGIQEKALAAAQELKRATMQTLFTRGLHGEAQRETEIGVVPESWTVESVNHRHSVVSGGTPSRARPEYWAGGTIPWVKTSEIGYRPIVETEESITPEALIDSAARMLPAGTLLMAMYGQGVTRGKVAVLGIDAACNQACAAISAKQSGVSPAFLYHFLTYRYDDIRVLAHGGQQQNLSLQIVKGLPLAVPPELSEQNGISEILDALDRKLDLHHRKRAVLNNLFKSLLHKLMNGEIRVTDLDLQAMGPDHLADASKMIPTAPLA